jgi:type I pantothenate kinase
MTAVADLIETRRAGRSPYLVGITGSVAVGKSTFALELQRELAERGARTEILTTDGFLFPNAALEAMGILGRKGFPETYDFDGMRSALAAIRTGDVDVPGYSHVIYDIDPALTRRLETPDILIVEGLGLHEGAAALGLDLLIYLDADEADMERWFTERLIGLWRDAEHDPTSFYARFRGMTEPQARAFAGQVWRSINLPNLREHIVAGRDAADVVVRKGPGHAVVEVAAH